MAGSRLCTNVGSLHSPRITGQCKCWIGCQCVSKAAYTINFMLGSRNSYLAINFGFLRNCGTQDYEMAVALPMLTTLERRGEGISISLDVAGAFDRWWWNRTKSRLEARGMTGSALFLLRDYLFRRFIRVVCGGESSSLREFFSSVPQGGLLSPDLWDFDISDLPSTIEHGEFYCYADDLGLWYEITAENASFRIDQINADLARLLVWGADNKTAFEPSKTSAMLVSLKRSHRFNGLSGIRMAGSAIKEVDQIKLVGFIFDLPK